MFERAPVRVDRRRTGQDRSVADRLQSAPATRLARPPDADRVRCPMSGHDHRRSGRSSYELSRFGTNVRAPESLPSNCLRGGEAYVTASVSAPFELRIFAYRPRVPRDVETRYRKR